MLCLAGIQVLHDKRVIENDTESEKKRTRQLATKQSTFVNTRINILKQGMSSAYNAAPHVFTYVKWLHHKL